MGRGGVAKLVANVTENVSWERRNGTGNRRQKKMELTGNGIWTNNRLGNGV